MAILVSSATLEQSERVATVFVLAQSYAALDANVEMYFVGPSIQLLSRAQQAQLLGYGSQRWSLAQHLQQTLGAQVKLFACTQAAQAFELKKDQLIAEASWGGIIQYASRCLEPGWQGQIF